MREIAHLRDKELFQVALKGGFCIKTPNFALHKTYIKCQSAKKNNLSNKTKIDGACTTFLDVNAFYVGVVIPKRYAKRAVRRNLIRRQVYSTAKEHLHQLQGRVGHWGEDVEGQGIFVVRLRREFDRERFVSASSNYLKQEIRAQMMSLWMKCFEMQIIYRNNQ